MVCYAESALWDYVCIVQSSNKVSEPIEAEETSTVNQNSLIYNRLEVKLSFVYYDL